METYTAMEKSMWLSYTRSLNLDIIFNKRIVTFIWSFSREAKLIYEDNSKTGVFFSHRVRIVNMWEISGLLLLFYVLIWVMISQVYSLCKTIELYSLLNICYFVLYFFCFIFLLLLQTNDNITLYSSRWASELWFQIGFLILNFFLFFFNLYPLHPFLLSPKPCLWQPPLCSLYLWSWFVCLFACLL